MTYDDIITLVKAEIIDVDSSFDTHADELMHRAQLRIENDLDINASRKETTLTASGVEVSLPTDLVLIQHLQISNSDFLTQKDRAFLREFWPDKTVTGTPRYYAYKDDTTIILAPVPDNTTLELVYTARLPKLTSTVQNNWLTDNAPNLLQYSLLIELAIWTKDAELQKVYKEEYNRALASTAITYNLRKRMGEYKTGAPKAGVQS